MEIKLDNGFYFGIGAFETILLHEKKLIFLSEHLKRLDKALNFFKINNSLNVEDLYNFINKNQHFNGAIKIIVSEKNSLFEFKENPYNQSTYEKGFSLTKSKLKKNEYSPITYFKTLNYAENILERQKAIEKGYNEAIFLNTKNQITEGTVSNIFFVKNNIIYTPKISCGLLNGIMRQYILSNYNINEKIITLDMMDDFDEAFLTNSLMGIMPVLNFEDKIFESKKVSNEILNNYKKLIG